MAREKSELKSGISIAARIFVKLIEAVEDEGGNDADVRRIETDENLRSEIAKLIVGSAKFVLKHLKLIANNIAVSVPAFTKDSFFKNGPAKLWLADNFRTWVLQTISGTIPSFTGNLAKFELTKSMCDSEIQKELGNPEPFTPSEFASIVKSLIEKQPQGESGTLLKNGYVNVFYVKLPARNASHSEAGGNDSRVVAVNVGWGSDSREWNLDVYVLDDGIWGVGDRVFSRRRSFLVS